MASRWWGEAVWAWAVLLAVMGTSIALCQVQGNALATGPRRLTKIINSYPAPSPDGGRVVFQSNRTGVFQIYSMKADGTEVQQLTRLRSLLFPRRQTNCLCARQQ